MSARLPRVLVLVENLSVPFDRRVWQESRALVDAGYDVVVICPMGVGRDEEPEVVLDGVRILRYPLRAASAGPAGYVREYGAALWHTARLALRVRREGRIDAVHACNPPDLLLPAVLPLKALGAKFVFDQHDLVPELFLSRFPRGGRWLLEVAMVCERLTYALADAVISTNESYRQVAIDRGRKHPDRVQVVRSAPDLGRFTASDADPGLRRGKRHLAAYLGVMGPQDGIDYALRALAHLRHDLGRDDLHTIFMGSGDCFAEVVELCARLGLDDCVEFTGRVPDEFVQRCLSTADVCLAPDPRTPLNDVSSMNKIVEYMALGRPIVAFDLVEARVSAGGAALYAPADDESAFAKLVDELLGDPSRREEMGGIGRARVAGELSWAHSRRNLTDFYERIVPLAPSGGTRRGLHHGRGSTGTRGRLGWYATRVRMMGPREIGWRIAAAAGGSTRRLTSRARIRGVLGDPTGSGWGRAFQSFQAATDRPVVLDRARAAAIAHELPDEADAVVRAADAVRAGSFAFFGHPPVRYLGRIDWNYDPRTGCRWPDRPAARINHRTHGDAKWIWELNRLQHLPWLAQAWLFTGDDTYAEAALAQLDSWLDQNPTGRGIAWRGGFEAGLRAISVAIAVQGLRDSPAMTLERYRRIGTMLAESADLCWRDRSRFSSANNHLLGELAGAATVGILFPELAGAQRWEQGALTALAREADRQILPDGAGAEQSSAYLIFSAQLLLVPAALLQLRGDEAPAAIRDAVQRSARFLADLVGGGDPLPRYGDEDGGFALRLHPEPVATLERHLAAVEATIGGPRPVPADLSARWIGTPGADRERVRPPVRTGSWYAPHGGVAVLRRPQQRIMMDVGPLGYLSLAAHGHADALAVTVAADGHDLVGDPGTGSYYAEPSWRRAFRRTRMHATVAVDDLDQSVAGGPFMWTRHAATSVRCVDLARGVVEAEHDGYTRLDDPVRHRRYLVAPPDRDWMLVLDLLEGTGRHRCRTSWPLHPDLDVAEHGTTHVMTRAGVPVLQVASAGTAPLDLYRVRGDDDEGLGWWSHRFEARTPAWLIGAVVESAECPAAIATVLTVAQGRELRVEDVAVVRDGSGMVDVTWTDGANRPSVRVDTRSPGAVSYNVLVPA